MSKLKDFIVNNHAQILVVIFATTIIAVIYFMGMKSGVEQNAVEKTKAEIVVLKTVAKEIIIKERQADKRKKINEISDDIDRILDSK
jgi:hypothetical protein